MNGPIIQNISRTAELEQVDAGVWCITALQSPEEIATATFGLINDVAIYGGFPSGGGIWENRNPIIYETILSGDLNGDDGPDFANNGENSYHVVTGSGTGETAILDGFTIIAGNSNNGRGMYNYVGSPTVANCTFSGNAALHNGGGMYNHNASSPTVTNCTFINNSAQISGGGMANIYNDSNPTLTNCTFSGNKAGDSGGGMHNWDSNPTLSNCTFTGNSASDGEAGIFE